MVRNVRDEIYFHTEGGSERREKEDVVKLMAGMECVEM